ncbi:MAG: hypothetical protein H6822_11525 [Planctomycetaceae bacterium]|nr:hypothetical protein [Planctomycetales bacterium]MCB9922805.1 hypothetical protein [Planctomycetaceae bacterium]
MARNRTIGRTHRGIAWLRSNGARVRRSSGRRSQFRLFLEQLEDRRLLAAGDLDSTFGTGGLVTTDLASVTAGLSDKATGIAIQQDGKLVVVGSAKIGPGSDFAVVRYHANGVLDPTFSVDGKLTADFGGEDTAQRVAIDADGKLIVVGQSGTDFALARFDTFGNLDTTFGNGGKVTTDFGSDEGIGGMAIDADGKIIVAGYTETGGAAGRDIALARYNSSGSLDPTFGNSGIVITDISVTDALLDIELDTQGRIVGAGYSVRPGGSDFDFTLVRYNADGTLDNSLDGDGIQQTNFSSGSDVARSLTIDGLGRLILTGDAGIATFDFAAARYNTDGSLDTTFSGDGKVTTDFGGTTDRGYWGAGIDPLGNLVVAGYSTQGSTSHDFALSRYTSSGNLDTSFGNAGIVTTDFGAGNPDFGLNMAIQADGKIVVVGESAQGATSSDFAVARYDSGFTVAVPGVTITPPTGLTTTEAGGTATFTAVLNTEPAANVTFRLISSDTSEGNVSPISLTFTPANWNVAQTVTVTGADDLNLDGDVVYTINTANTVSNDLNYNGLNPIDVSVINVDNDVETLTLTIAASSFSEAAGVGASTATISRNTDPANPLTVTLMSNDTSEATVPATVTIPAGQASMTFSLGAVDDNIIDGQQTVMITASASGHANSTDSVIVTDDDVAGFTVTGASTKITWSDSGASGTDPFGVPFTSTPNQTLPSWGMPGFNSGTTKFLAPGSYEAFRVTFSGLPAGVVINATHPNTVLNVTPFSVADLWNKEVTGNSILFTSPDPVNKRLDQNDWFFTSVIFSGLFDASQLAFEVEYISGPGVTVSEAGSSQTVQISLDAQPAENVVLNIASADTGEATVDKAALTFTPANWNVAQDVTVTGADDQIADGDQLTEITIAVNDAVSDDAFDGVLDQVVTATTTDDDGVSLALILEITDAIISEDAGPAATTATVTRTGDTSGELIVSLASSDTTELSAPATVTIPVGQSSVQFDIGAVDDAIVDGTQTVTLTASANGYPDGTDSVDVTDDDAARLTLSLSTGQSDTVDQSSETGGSVGGVDHFAPMGQSFVPTRSGLDYVVLKLSDNTTARNGVTGAVRIRQSSITGTVLGTSDPVFFGRLL